MDAVGDWDHRVIATLCDVSVSTVRAAIEIRSLVLWGMLICLPACGCTFGAHMLESSVGPYNAAVTRVSEEQLLHNVVRLRYNDNPTRLDVASIAAQYELDASAEARPFFAAPNPAGAVFETFAAILPDLMASGANRPTISLTPLDDPETIRGLFTPATLDGIVFLAETSYPLSTVFQLFVESINGVPNAPSASGPPRSIVPEFREFKRAAEILQQLKDLGDLQFVREEKINEYGSRLSESSVTAAALVEAAKNGFEYHQQPDKSWSLVKRERRLMLQIRPEALARPELTELTSLMHLKPGQSRYEVTVGSKESLSSEGRQTASTTFNIFPRSVIQASYYLSHGVVVPSEHVACGLAKSPVFYDGRSFDWQELFSGLFTVHSVQQYRRPACASVAVKYRDYWFYIDDRDADSKATFSLLMTMTRINLLGTRKGGPTLTLPVAGR
ncbi:MAG TPA: hypothetical protein VHX68_20800 [Planctomycetaceae bacterium]|nr:hypothetical protein [Planctomycetaceae bacterium]